MDMITKETGVRLREDPIIWDLLPWGRDTAIQAKLKNVTLREALRRITNTFGLTFVLRDEYVEIQPLPALRRLAQRASREELQALDILASRPAGLNTDHPTIKQLLEAVDAKLAAEKDAQYAIENRIGEAIKPDKTVFVPRNATLMDALESLTKETKATWYPWGKNILIVTKEDRTRRLLNKPLTIRPGERGVDVLQLLMDISQQTGVTFEMQPGLMQSIGPDARLVRGVFDNAPAQQILEAVSAATGLSYTIQDDKVHIAPATAAANNAAGPREPTIGLLQLDNGMQVLVPQSQVPPDLREYIKYKTQKELAKIRKMMEEEKFQPPPPATQPAKDDHDM